MITVKKVLLLSFDGELVEEKGEWLVCEGKNIKVLTESLRYFMRSSIPIGQKHTVGLKIDSNNIDGDLFCEMWRDEKYIHIGCLKEEKSEFSKKYVQLIKHLNSNKDVRNP